MPTPLEQEHEQLLEFVYACPVGLAQADATGAMSFINPMAMQLLMPLGAVRHGMNLFRTLATYAPDLPALVKGFEAPHGQICQGRRIFVGEAHPRPDKLPQVLACTIVKLDDERYMATLEDVSEQVAQERRLKQAEVWFASLIDHADGFAVVGLDAEGRIETMNASARQQTGFGEAEIVGQPLTALDRPDPASSAIGSLEEVALARRDGWHLAEAWCAHRDGTRFRCQRLICVRNETERDGRQHVTGFTVVLRQVSTTGLDTDLLRRRLTTDHVTGVCNRAHFFELAEMELRRCAHAGRDVGVITLDIDHFKRVNDEHGHAVGDQVLRAVAEACERSLRSGDTFARLGGEEFVALVPATDADAVRARAEIMRVAAATARVRSGSLDLQITASFGCAVGQAAITSINTLLEQADKALYCAKRNGRNRIEFDTGGERAVA